MFRTSIVSSPVFMAAEKSDWIAIALFILLCSAVAIPVLSVPVPPLADYPNHLARMHVIATIDQDPLLAQFYRIDWQIIPNLIMDLIVPVLARHLDIYLSGQIFILMTMVLLVTGPLAVQTALYRSVTIWPLVAFLFVYNNILLLGFMNYLFGLGVALWGIAAWIWLRQHNALLRALVSLSVILVLFFCHLFAVGLYGLTVFCFEAWHFWTGEGADRRTGVIDALVLTAPPLAILPLMLASPTLHLAGDYDWVSSAKLDGLLYIFHNYSDIIDLPIGAAVIGAGVWAARHRLLRLHPAGWYVLATGSAVYMLMPRVMFGSWAADLRMPIALVFIEIGFIRFTIPGNWCKWAFLVLVTAITLTRATAVQATWRQIDDSVFADLRQSLPSIVPGSRVLVAYADQPEGSEAINTSVSHAICLAMIERSSMVSTAFTVPGKQPLQVTPEYSDMADSQDGDPPTISQLIAAAITPELAEDTYWYQWEDKFDYVYILYTKEDDDWMPDMLTLVHHGRQLQLFKVVPPDED